MSYEFTIYSVISTYLSFLGARIISKSSEQIEIKEKDVNTHIRVVNENFNLLSELWQMKKLWSFNIHMCTKKHATMLILTFFLEW